MSVTVLLVSGKNHPRKKTLQKKKHPIIFTIDTIMWPGTQAASWTVKSF